MSGRAVFTLRSARSGSLIGAAILVIAIETAVLHLWLAPSHPIVAWALTLVSLLSAGWLMGDYRAMGDAALVVEETAITLHVGWRAMAVVPHSAISAVTRASWREIPQPGTATSYLNLTKPAEPNVLVACDPPASVRLFGRVSREAQVIGLHVDAPDALVAHVQEMRGLAPR